MSTSGDDAAGDFDAPPPPRCDPLSSTEILLADQDSANRVEINDSQTPKPKAAENLKTIYVGMVFETMEEAKDYYQYYGRQEGFWVRTQSSRKPRSGSNEVTNVKLVCAHQGKIVPKNEKVKVAEEIDRRQTSEEGNKKKRVRNCSMVKGGCKANMRIKHDKWTNKWEVSIFCDDHNHKVVTPARRMKMKSNRHMPKAAKDLTEAFHRENLQIGKVPSIIGGAQIGFDNRDCYNHLRDVRHRDLEGGDAQSVLSYFRKKQAENPQFFYAIQCDETGRTANFFWVDARSRMAYHYFGDVVSFDTTYRTNKYDMPFAPFTGVNHHFQSIQYGCALLQDETETTFLWLFKTWLEAMGGRHPVSIITNQDLAMKGAISKVLPNTCHRLCLWHIKKKFCEKLSHIYYKKSKFKYKLKKCIQWTYKVNDFEDTWKALMVVYELEDNEWLQHLYEIRASWVPVYNRGTFYAGMNTMGRSEGVNAFFDAFITSQTNLREFVVKYEQALKRIIKRESDEDFESEHKYRIVNDDDFILKHASQLYTRNIFIKFKDEWNQVNRYKVEEGARDDAYHTYLLKTKVGEPEEFVVKLNLQTYEGTCACKKFEFFGILCKHILKVFVRLDIYTIPSHFILARWRQEANKFRFMDLGGPLRNDGGEQIEALRLNHICQESTKLACYAAQSVEAYTIYIETLKELSKKLQLLIGSTTISSGDVPEPQTNVYEHVDSQCNNLSSQLILLDPNISQTKGRKKDVKVRENDKESSGRIKSGIELALQKKKRKCALCHKLGHDKRICPSNTKRRKIDSNKQLSKNKDIKEFVEDTESDHEE